MPIRGRSFGDAASTFIEHLNMLLHATVTQVPLSLEVLREGRSPVANVRFRTAGAASTVPLVTRYGPMRIYVGQLCDSLVDAERQHVLRTTAYRYALFPADHNEPLLRWEFVRWPGNEARYCRQHLQGPLRVGVMDQAGREASLQDWHLPTGEVALEEVLRFCIVDLGVTPLASNWHDVLSNSYARFRTEFNTFDA
jgi:hypothetical protein